MKPSIDLAVSGIRDWLDERWDQIDFNIEVKDDPTSPWLLVDAERRTPFFEEEGTPEKVSFAVWRETGAVHRCEEGMVKDPELFILEEPPTPAERAKRIREEVERSMMGRLQPSDARAIESVVAQVIEEAQQKGIIP